MDATSASGNGFDAALKALEDLETSVGQTREEKPAAPAAEPVSIGFSEVEAEDQPAAIIAVPIAELEMMIPDLSQFQPAAPAARPVAAPAPVPIAIPAAEAPSRMVKIAVGLSLFSSLISAVGLVVAERTIMSAQLVVADARERARQLEQSNKLVRDLEMIRDRQVELLQQQQQQLASTPVTSAELTHRMEVLQAGLIEHAPLNQVIEAVKAGQADTNAHFSEFAMKMARVEAALGQK